MALKIGLINIFHRAIRFGASTVWACTPLQLHSTLKILPMGSKLQYNKIFPICISDTCSFKVLCNVLKNIVVRIKMIPNQTRWRLPSSHVTVQTLEMIKRSSSWRGEKKMVVISTDRLATIMVQEE